MKELERKLPNGHILHNPGTENEWESWKDSFGNEIQEDIVIPLRENTYITDVWVRCNCPFCNEEIDVEAGGNALSNVYCPECDKPFQINLED